MCQLSIYYSKYFLVIVIVFQLSSFCGQLKLYAKDNKKYISDVINEEGVRLLLTIIPSKYKKQIQDRIQGMLDPIDEQSKKKAYDFYKTNLIETDEIGKTISLQKNPQLFI